MIKHNGMNLISEEQEWASTKIMLILFYLVVYIYTVIEQYFVPLYLQEGEHTGSTIHGSSIGMYTILLFLFPLAIYLKKTGKVYWIKYIYFFTFQFLSAINDIVITGDMPYQGGNFFDVLLVLISPIFFNRRFFWIISIGAILKYAIIGIILRENIVILPIIFLFTFMVGSFIIISRLLKYINAVKNAEKVLAKSEKLVAVGELAAGITHEIRNPLASLKGFIQLNKETIKEQHYEIMIKEINRINKITSGLLHLAKPQNYQIKQIDIQNVMDYSINLLNGRMEKSGITLERNFPKDLPPIYGAEVQIIQVIVNLIKNSIEAMENGGKLLLDIEHINKYIKISIVDTGIGISEENLMKIGESFFTTKKDGTGLGMTVCKKIIQDHNGDIIINSKEGAGTKIIVSLPCY